jgi:hypothetical protein
LYGGEIGELIEIFVLNEEILKTEWSVLFYIMNNSCFCFSIPIVEPNSSPLENKMSVDVQGENNGN